MKTMFNFIKTVYNSCRVSQFKWWFIFTLFVSSISGCWDGSSPLGISDVVDVSEIEVVGIRAASDFSTSGVFYLILIPFHNGEPVLAAGIRDFDVMTEDPSYHVYLHSRDEKSPRKGTEIAGVILLDSSGSMSWMDPDRLRVDASYLFIDRLDRSRVPFTLAVYDFGGGRFTPPCFRYTRILQDYSREVQALREGVEQTIANGSTPLFYSAKEVVEDHGLRFRGIQYRRVILLLSDGEDNWGSSAEEVVEETRMHDVEILAVSLGAGADEVALSKMATGSGGSTINVMDAEGLLNKFDGLAATLTQSYLEAQLRIDPVPPSGTTISLRIEANKKHRPVYTNALFTSP